MKKFNLFFVTRHNCENNKFDTLIIVPVRFRRSFAMTDYFDEYFQVFIANIIHNNQINHMDRNTQHSKRYK